MLLLKHLIDCVACSRPSDRSPMCIMHKRVSSFSFRHCCQQLHDKRAPSKRTCSVCAEKLSTKISSARNRLNGDQKWKSGKNEKSNTMKHQVLIKKRYLYKHISTVSERERTGRPSRYKMRAVVAHTNNAALVCLYSTNTTLKHKISSSLLQYMEEWTRVSARAHTHADYRPTAQDWRRNSF